MSEELKPNQALFIWKLLTATTAEEREPQKSKAKPDLKKDLLSLVERGYVALEKRGRAQHLMLTDKAWAWAERTEQVKLMKSKSKVGADALEGLLHRLIPFLQQKRIPLASIFSQSEGRVESPSLPIADAATLALLIEQACLRLTGGRRKERVSLAALRQKLGSVPRTELDDALRQLQRDGKLVLFREDNSAALTPADQAAALLVGDSPRHIVYLEN